MKNINLASLHIWRTKRVDDNETAADMIKVDVQETARTTLVNFPFRLLGRAKFSPPSGTVKEAWPLE